MKEFIEKLIGRLEEKFKYNSEQAEIYRDGSDKDAYFREMKDLYRDRANTYGQVMRIVKELAEEYNNGWIPCSERLPSFDGAFICTAKEVEESLELIYSSFDNSWMDEFDGEYEVIAWMPLPAPYKENENGKI